MNNPAENPLGHVPESQWYKSSYSNAGNNCVEVAHLNDGGTAVRDSKDKSVPALRFTASEWSAFLAGTANGEFAR